MRQVQDAVAEMRQTLESSFGQIAEGLRQELGRLEKEQVDTVFPKQEPVPTPEPVVQPAYPLEQVEQAHVEAIQLERESADARLAEYQTQVEAQLKAHLESETQRQAEMTAAVQRQLEELQTGREREREAAKNIQAHLANQLRELRAVATQGTLILQLKMLVVLLYTQNPVE